MAEQIFISPAVKFSEKDLTFVSQTLNPTSLGMVGETPKGPAFEPITVTSREEFARIFGLRSNEKIGNKYKYLTNYYANSFLEESNNLTITRVLGLSGYEAGKGWAITTLAAPDLSTVSAVTTTTGNDTFTDGQYLGIDVPLATGLTTTGQTDFVRVGATYTATTYILETTSIDTTVLSGTTDFTAITQSYLPIAEYDNMVVGIVRSRADYSLNDLEFRTTGLTISSTGNSATSNVLGDFILETTGAVNNESYMVSLDKNKRNFISNVIGDKPKGKNNLIYVESIYPELVNKLATSGFGFGISPVLVELDTNIFTDYNAQYQTPTTPYVVSELKGNELQRLFRFISISDGTSANKQIKISIQNIDLRTREFSVVIRDFNDTDSNPVVLETFTRCSLRKDDISYVGRRIGAIDENGDILYPISSSYVYLELNFEADDSSIPAGFEGYVIRNYDSSNTGSISALTPKMFYKTSYTQDDRVRRTYLGISETAFGLQSGINQNLYNFTGAVTLSSGYTKTEGFHLDSGATLNYPNGTFQTGEGAFGLSSDLLNLNNPYIQANTAKFTLVPYGGFDGWDEHRDERTNRGVYKRGRSLFFENSDYEAYLKGINTFGNAEETTINMFATPGIDWDRNLELVQDALDLVEDDRAGDCIYVIDAPDLPDTDGTAQEYSELFEDKAFNTSYACTYVPYIRVNDNTNSTQVIIPPTGEVLKAMAFTDRVRGAWFAPAGLQRGTITANNVRKKFSQSERDILYASRLNPLAYFNDTGVTIFGQKTMQVRQSALDRINVRRLLIYLRQIIAQISRNLLFEQNDSDLRNEFKNQVNPLMERVQRDRGLSGFRIVMDETNNPPEVVDRNEIRGEILIKPTPTAEFFNIGFTLLPSGASFDDV